MNGRGKERIKQEVEFQKRAAALGLSPEIIGTDNETYIEMMNINRMCIADWYGETIENIPERVINKIYNIIVRLYLECDIAYLDVTPYNFIEETNGRVWIIDFGDARKVPEKDDWLQETFKQGRITRWNPEFR